MTTADLAACSKSSVTARKAAVSAMVASSIEWYDFFIYGTAAALFFGKAFFPGISPVAGVLAAFSTTAVGFFARPVGGIIAGHFGDKIGRKPVLITALVLMGAATTLVGTLPDYSTIGLAAPIILVLLRFAQGLAVGGQWGGAMLLATEHAPAGKKGLYGSFAQLGVPLGLIGGNLIFLFLSNTLGPKALDSWGWRVPFLLSIVMIFVAMFIHRSLEETPAFRAVEEKLTAANKGFKSPVLQVLRQNPRQILLVAGAFWVVNSTFYIMVTGTLDYGTRNLHLNRNDVLTAVLLANGIQVIAVPLFAALSDRFGRRRIYAIGAAALAIWAVPMWLLIDNATFGSLLIAQVVGACCLSMMYGPQPALVSEMFSAEVRYSGASLGYQIASLIGGMSPVIMVLLVDQTGTSLSIAALIIIMSTVALASIAMTRLIPVPAPYVQKANERNPSAAG